MGEITRRFHDKVVYNQRMTRLTEVLLPMLENSKNILDLGCGDGRIDSYILDRRRDMRIQGIDVLVRPETYIPVEEYDGRTIPFSSGTYDTVMAVDVLHHTDDPGEILKEMTRVSSRYIVIKDHIWGGYWSCLKLKAMDYVGNAHYSVRLPYNYQRKEQWEQMFEACGLRIVKYQTKLNLYTGLLHLLFDRRLHFIALLKKV